MPSGKIHALATSLTAGVAGPLIALTAGQPLAHALAFSAGCLVGLVATPDLDVRGRDTHAETIMRRSGGCLVGSAWNLLWLPYAYLIPHHRHWLSHAPVIGTLVRLVYLAALPGLAWALLSLALPSVALPGLPIPTTWLAWGLAGLAVVDALHGLMDRLF